MIPDPMPDLYMYERSPENRTMPFFERAHDQTPNSGAKKKRRTANKLARKMRKRNQH